MFAHQEAKRQMQPEPCIPHAGRPHSGALRIAVTIIYSLEVPLVVSSSKISFGG